MANLKSVIMKKERLELAQSKPKNPEKKMAEVT